MLRYLIVASEGSSGRGTRWLNLYRFLKIFHGRRGVRVVTPSQLLTSRPIQTETVLIGLPTSVSAEHLVKVNFDRAALFDYRDLPQVQWDNSDEPFLRSITNTVLRPWVEADWDDGLNWGVLPIRRSVELSAHLTLRELVSRQLTHIPEQRDIDVSFIGTGTAPSKTYNQRIEWLRELRQTSFSFWGGLLDSPLLAHTAAGYGDVSDLVFGKRRVGFFSYFKKLLQSRVALTPAGFARWSYRHYEAIYAGAIPVSTDFRGIQTLIPLPLEGMIHVPDGEPVAAAVEAGIRLRKEQPETVEENILSLEKYLQAGDYSRKKPELLERFESQLDAA